MPDRLARAGHAHGQVQQRHGRGRLRVLVQHRLVAANAREVVHVAGLGHPHDRVDQQVGLRLARGAEGQLLMGAVQGVARLERHDLPPAQLAEIGPQLVGRVAPRAEVVMRGRLEPGDAAAQIDRPGDVVQVVHRRMGQIVGAVDRLGLARLVGGPLVGHRQDRQDHAFRVAQRDVLAVLDAARERLRHVQRDRHRPERAVRQAHPLDHAVVVLAPQEPRQRREAPVHQQLQVADLPGRQIPGRQIARVVLHLLGAVPGDVEFGDGDEVGDGGGHEVSNAVSWRADTRDRMKISTFRPATLCCAPRMACLQVTSRRPPPAPRIPGAPSCRPPAPRPARAPPGTARPPGRPCSPCPRW